MTKDRGSASPARRDDADNRMGQEASSLIERFDAVRWRCQFCRKSWSSRWRAGMHASYCWFNPAVRACKTCEHFSPATRSRDPEEREPQGCDEGRPNHVSILSQCSSWTARTPPAVSPDPSA